MEATSACKRARVQKASVEEVSSCGSEVGVSGQTMEGFPDHLAMECLARVPLSSLRGVCKAWQKLLYDPHFQSLRAASGNSRLDWVYTLVQLDDKTFKWRAFDPLASQWHDLPPPPHPMEFHLSNPDCIGVFYSVQCASTSTKLVMVSAIKARRSRTDGHHNPRMTTEPALQHPYIFDTHTGAWTHFGSRASGASAASRGRACTWRAGAARIGTASFPSLWRLITWVMISGSSAEACRRPSSVAKP